MFYSGYVYFYEAKTGIRAVDSIVKPNTYVNEVLPQFPICARDRLIAHITCAIACDLIQFSHNPNKKWIRDSVE